MRIKVLFFGVLAEVAGESDAIIEDMKTLEELKAFIIKKHPLFAGYKYQVSLNRMLIQGDQKLNEGDEIAFLPPFAGG